MKHLLQISLAALGLFFTSCASSFHSINPQKIPFSYTENTPEVQFSYRYDILSLHKNKKYAKKESKHGLRVVAVRITNNSGKTLRLNDNLKIFVGNNQTVPIDPTVVTKTVKQKTWIYLLYTPLILTISTNSTNYSPNGMNRYTETISKPYFIGPPVALSNLALATYANSKFNEEIKKFDIINKPIEPGQTVYGLVTVPSIAADPIKFEVQ